ncbi:type II toxin-antitoxin system RatA family toxin [Candidatus Methylocalor cossyra]|uniref:Ribosome association toxin RatA n=1 Tax=Candidatus Methylocalor cossyra TaxID=3108543 RepID=A0ABP1C4Z0_9GAMM
MTNICTSVCVNYTPLEMYNLVNDVQAYPNYLPLCTAVTLHARSPTHLRATITLAKGKLKLSFTTDNAMEEGRSIDMRLVEGPFKHFHGSWRFDPTPGGGCETTFRLDFEFANGLLGLAFGGFFKDLTESLVDAFCNEAVKKYGQRPQPRGR